MAAPSGRTPSARPSFPLAWFAPAAIFTLAAPWTAAWPPAGRWAGAAAVLLLWALPLLACRQRLNRRLRTVHAFVAAIREGDCSLRVRGGGAGDPLGELVGEVNALGDVLREQRAGSRETQALLDAVREEIETAVFAFDDRLSLRYANRAGLRLLGLAALVPGQHDARGLGMEPLLAGDPAGVAEHAFPGASGRWAVRRTPFREGGRPQTLLLLTDLSHALRDEERTAWKRLLRVLGHELNNSLAPVRSISGSLRKILRQPALPEDWREDVEGGLSVIENRAENLHRFLEGYSRLAKLPAPQPEDIDLAALLRRVAALETRLAVTTVGEPDVFVRADAAQLEQALINLLRNAADAAAPAGGEVCARWARDGGTVTLRIEDDGPGIQNPDNLFVPFFTTKPNGSGIGLAISRQIAEAHGGTLELRNRPGARGAEAILRLPAARPPA